MEVKVCRAAVVAELGDARLGDVRSIVRRAFWQRERLQAALLAPEVCAAGSSSAWSDGQRRRGDTHVLIISSSMSMGQRCAKPSDISHARSSSASLPHTMNDGCWPS